MPFGNVASTVIGYRLRERSIYLFRRAPASSPLARPSPPVCPLGAWGGALTQSANNGRIDIEQKQ